MWPGLAQPLRAIHCHVATACRAAGCWARQPLVAQEPWALRSYKRPAPTPARAAATRPGPACIKASRNCVTQPGCTFPLPAGGRRGWQPPSSAGPSPPHGSPSCGGQQLGESTSGGQASRPNNQQPLLHQQPFNQEQQSTRKVHSCRCCMLHTACCACNRLPRLKRMRAPAHMSSGCPRLSTQEHPLPTHPPAEPGCLA